MPKLVHPDSALDWYTFRQLCEGAAADLVHAYPNAPRTGRIDLYREVTVRGRAYIVRAKFTVVPAGKAARRTDDLIPVAADGL